MNLVNASIAVTRDILTGDSWGVNITVYPPSLSEGVTIKGMTTNHTNLYDPDDGTKKLSRSINATIVEASLNEQGISTRNSEGYVDIYNWRMDTVFQGEGITTFVVREVHPDEKLGVLRLILSDYGAN